MIIHGLLFISVLFLDLSKLILVILALTCLILMIWMHRQLSSQGFIHVLLWVIILGTFVFIKLYTFTTSAIENTKKLQMDALVILVIGYAVMYQLQVFYYVIFNADMYTSYNTFEIGILTSEIHSWRAKYEEQVNDGITVCSKLNAILEREQAVNKELKQKSSQLDANLLEKEKLMEKLNEYKTGSAIVLDESDFTQQQTIGKGAYGIIVKAFWKTGSIHVAIKELVFADEKMLNLVKKEVNTLLFVFNFIETNSHTFFSTCFKIVQ